MKLEREHVFSACCTLAVLSLENLAANRTAFFADSYLPLNLNRVSGFLDTVCKNLYHLDSAIPYLLEKSSLCPGFDSFYQWHESFGALMCYCPACQKETERIDALGAEFSTFLEFYEQQKSPPALTLSSYSVIHTACTHLSQVSHYGTGTIARHPITDPIRHKILSTIRRDRGMQEDTGEESWRLNLTLSNAYLSFYERNIINYSLAVLGDDYLVLKNQLYGYAA